MAITALFGAMIFTKSNTGVAAIPTPIIYRETSQPRMTFSYAICLQLAAFNTPETSLFVMT